LLPRLHVETWAIQTAIAERYLVRATAKLCSSLSILFSTAAISWTVGWDVYAARKTQTDADYALLCAIVVTDLVELLVTCRLQQGLAVNGAATQDEVDDTMARAGTPIFLVLLQSLVVAFFLLHRFQYD